LVRSSRELCAGFPLEGVQTEECSGHESWFWRVTINHTLFLFLPYQSLFDLVFLDFGRFAAALNDLGLDCWVMNIVPVSGFNTLPVIYDRGLQGAMHDWYRLITFCSFASNPT